MGSFLCLMDSVVMGKNGLGLIEGLFVDYCRMDTLVPRPLIAYEACIDFILRILHN